MWRLRSPTVVLVAAICITGTASCESRNASGLAVRNEQESSCVRYAKTRDPAIRARIAAKQDAATMTAIDAGQLDPGLPALVAYCVHGAPVERHKTAAPEGEIEQVTFCGTPIEAGETCESKGPTITVAADRIAALPEPEA
jgi:hypothetical protein